MYNKFWLGSTSTELRDSIPVNAFGFVFPGEGREHPIQPGEEVVIALSAVEHTADQTSRPMNLAADNVWAMYIDRFAGSAVKAPAAGVERLECFCELASGNSMFSPSARRRSLYIGCLKILMSTLRTEPSKAGPTAR